MLPDLSARPYCQGDRYTGQSVSREWHRVLDVDGAGPERQGGTLVHIDSPDESGIPRAATSPAKKSKLSSHCAKFLTPHTRGHFLDLTGILSERA